MKILQISPQIPFPLTDGGKKSIFGLMKSLSKRGHEIHFVSYIKHTDYENALIELKKYCKPYFINVQTDNNFFDAFVNLFSKVPYNISKYHKKELKNFLFRFLKNEEVDIVHINNLHMAWCIDIVRNLTKAPVVLRQENLEMMIMKRFSENSKNIFLRIFSKLQYRKFINYEHRICEKFDKCIMISKIDEVLLLKQNNKIKTTTIPIGVEDELFEYEKKEIKPYTLAHIGHLDWYPNLDSLNWFLNKILPKIIKIEPNMELFIYGGGDQNKINCPESIKSNVHFEGFVKNIWEDLRDKALAVVPLRIGSGIRVKIIEMLAYGQNIITTSVGKEGIDINNKEHVLVADTESAFIEKILDYFNNKFDNGRMRSNGRKYIKENYSWEGIAQKFEELYLSLIYNFNK